MKLIELLEKIEKGDNLPQKIEVDDTIYYLDEEYRDYKNEYDGYLSEDIGSYAHIDLALKMEVNVLNDKIRVMLKPHIDIYDLSQNHWEGCKNDTLMFLDEYYNKKSIFEVDDDEVDNVSYIINGYFVNKKCFDVID